jgi:hypothetical protein
MSYHARSASIPTGPSHASFCSLRDAQFNDRFESSPLQPLPSALTHQSTHYDPETISPLEQIERTYQKTIANTFLDGCKPLVERATSTFNVQTARLSSHAPKKPTGTFFSGSQNLNASDEEKSCSLSKSRNHLPLRAWFAGTSAPLQIGFVPGDCRETVRGEANDLEQDEMFHHGPKFTSNPSRLQNSTVASKFSWILGANNISKQKSLNATHDQSADEDDELVNLNISHALSPNGPRDVLDPASFHELLHTAEQLLYRYREAYRAQATRIHDLETEQDVQDEELDEAETRAKHLKVQLDDMAARAAEHQIRMQELKKELEEERILRKQEDEARLRSVSLIRGPSCAQNQRSHVLRQQKRLSAASSIATDSGFESEDDSGSETSAFIHANRTSDSIGTVQSLAFAEPLQATVMTITRPNIHRRQSTYDKVIEQYRSKQSMTCARTTVGNIGDWDTVKQVKEENAALRRRCYELEEAVNDSLDMLGLFGR